MGLSGKKVKFIVSALVLTLPFFTTCFAQENITITTYYPSPQGSYDNLDVNNLQADRIAIGNGNNPTVIGNGVLDFIGLPTTPVPAGNAGSLYFDTTDNVFKWHNGTGWQDLSTAAILVFYSAGAPAITNCQPPGTHAVNVLDTGFDFVDAGTNLPQSGYLICH